uniref:Putative metallopeptidase family M24 n=1 Tax=uncultured marine microorganism HF4000_APKG8C21 TaxID=455553 RepID=B3TA25_9ZZZZ|nr:putative metallopeptidase family M24 [uncultured marine microorganism HF4000_APKG8C21]
MGGEDIAGWLLYDYRGMNPIFWDTVGPISHVTRPCWLWIPSQGEPRLLASYVDQGRFSGLGIATTLFVNRQEMTTRLAEMLTDARRIAMEYSPKGALPRVSRVDAGTLEMVRELGVEIVSSADLLQYATQRWSEEQLRSHLIATEKLDRIVHEAFRYVGEHLASRPTEQQVAAFIRRRFLEEELEAPDGPIVAVNEHASDPHFEPSADASSIIKTGDWLLIDLWARVQGEDTMFGDITWTAYVGESVPQLHRQVFEAVIGARDATVAALEEAFDDGRPQQGWELDRVAREYIAEAGFGDYFNHRLGHSLGREVHSNAVNLDSYETHDTRRIIPGIAVTVEPGIYLPEFGVRSEIDVYISESGPQVTTPVQRSVVLI